MDESIIKKEPLGNGFFINVSKHHTFGTDAVLLADFANAKKADKLIDLGTGCGIIPFLMLRDGNLKTAVGVDIKEAYSLVAYGITHLASVKDNLVRAAFQQTCT